MVNAVVKMYTYDGKRVKSQDELEDGGHYVACHRGRFVKQGTAHCK